MNNKLKSLTENRYTLNDIFTKKYQIWAIVPLVIYFLTPIIHMIIFSVFYNDDMSTEEFFHYIKTTELPGDNYTSIIQYSFVLGIFVAIIAVISFLANKKEKNIKRFPDNIPIVFFGAYFLLILISTIANKTAFNLIVGFTGRGEGVISLFCYYMVYYLCGSFVDKEKYKNFIIIFFLLIDAVIGTLTLINLLYKDINIIGNAMVSGIFYNSNFYAYFLAISIMISSTLSMLHKSMPVRIFSFILFCIDTFILSINDSLGGFLACFVAFIFVIVFLSLRDGKFCLKALGAFIVFNSIIFVTGLFVPSFFSEFSALIFDLDSILTGNIYADKAGSNRWKLWTHTAQYIREKPWIGWGFEGIAERLDAETGLDKAHNEYLENMAYFGIPAGIIYIAGLVSVYIKAIRRRKYLDNATVCCLAGALGYIGSALVGNSFVFTAPFCFIFLGLANSSLEKIEPVSAEKENEEVSSCE